MAPRQLPAPFHRDGWVFEEKVDGYRMLAYKDGARVRLVSRTGVDHTRRYPEVVAAIARLKAAALVLDGELAIFDEQFRSRFDWLRQPDAAALATPPVLIAFDLLYVNGHNVATRPPRERRTRLEQPATTPELLVEVTYSEVRQAATRTRLRPTAESALQSRGVFDYLITLACDAPTAKAAFQAWLRAQAAIIRPMNESPGPDAFTCTTSTGSAHMALWTGDVPMTLDAAVSDGIWADIKPLPQPLVRYTVRR
jgi:hypothetical protein